MIAGVSFIAFVPRWSLESTRLQHRNQISFVDIILGSYVRDVDISDTLLQDLSRRIIVNYLVL